MIKEFFNAKTIVLAHRGAPREAPENTIPSFKKALELGADVLETDIRFTADKRFVIIHDHTVDRTTDGSGPVKDYTLCELKKLDAGYRFSNDNGRTYPFRGRGITLPSLEELLEEFPSARFNIDMKDETPEQIEYYSEIINKYGAGKRVLTASRGTCILKKIRRIFPEMATSMGLIEIVTFYLFSKAGLSRLLITGGDALQVPEFYHGLRIATASFIKQAHQKKLKVHVWTINNEDKMKELLSMGADGIFTEAPVVLIKAIYD